ncbi:MAG: DUF4416 family protein [Planctomycetota bacterium]
MAQLHSPPEVAWICGLLAADGSWLDRARNELQSRLGHVGQVSPVWDFQSTRYYTQQMGPSLLRQFVTFDWPGQAETLAEVKVATNQLEADLGGRCDHPPRPVNLDPGYIALPKLVLASCKNFSHRIYIGRGVFAEVTLMWQQGRWRSLEWTFPDYRSGRYFDFFTEVRDRLAAGKAGSA